MKHKILLPLALLVAAAPLAQAATAPSPDLQAALDAMVAAERAFSQTSVEKGTKEAFVTFLADDGILFRPTPVPGKEWTVARPSPPATLVWQPDHAEISASGDMGYSTGPFEVRAKDGSRPPGHGHFFSVWKKQADGSWKVTIDVGVGHEAPSGTEPTAQGPAVAIKAGPVVASTSKADTAAEKAALLEQDRAFSRDAAARGVEAAYLARITESARLLRDDHDPFVGQEAVRGALAGAPAMNWEPLGGDVSQAGDFGYTYGKYQARPGGGSGADQPGHYVRVWRKHGSDWKLLADVINPLPPASPQPRPSPGR